uniref:GLOBIN domain-containing protein n=1 Tax=Meloidogyne hapla TaxID=6305 RepID=A0A1I8B2F9_MELHA
MDYSLSHSLSPTLRVPLTRKRQSFTVYEMITNNERKQQKQLFNNWHSSENNNNSIIGQSIKDVMKELTRPTVQFCFGNNLENSNNHLPLNNNTNSMPSLIKALAQAEKTIMAHNYYLQQTKQKQYYSYSNNRSPSVSGNFSIGLTTTTNKGRRLSERLINENNNNNENKGRLERSNSVLASRNGNINLNFLPELTPQQGIERELRLIGARHVPSFEYFDLNVTKLEQLGEALAEQFFKLDGIRQSKETTKVWRTLIAHIIDHIRDGYETELRLKRRKRTTNALLTGNCGDVGGGPPNVVMALAPFESKFFK